MVGFWQRLRSRGHTFDHIVTHGNAIGVYFPDPEGNRVEVYWNTGLQAHQPFSMPVNLEEGAEEIMRQVREAVAKYGETGPFGAPALEGPGCTTLEQALMSSGGRVQLAPFVLGSPTNHEEPAKLHGTEALWERLRCFSVSTAPKGYSWMFT